jgi:hypothetical protein
VEPVRAIKLHFSGEKMNGEAEEDFVRFLLVFPLTQMGGWIVEWMES